MRIGRRETRAFPTRPTLGIKVAVAVDGHVDELIAATDALEWGEDRGI
jgi:hypothetical protein